MTIVRTTAVSTEPAFIPCLKLLELEGAGGPRAACGDADGLRTRGCGANGEVAGPTAIVGMASGGAAGLGPVAGPLAVTGVGLAPGA